MRLSLPFAGSVITMFVVSSLTSYAQTAGDTIPSKTLKEVIIKGWIRRDIGHLPEVQNNTITTGKKSEEINLAATNANIAIKTARQVFAKVPGVFVYDMDGSGNQVNIATRGLDPHRSWEFNLRQNGVITNSDMYGYPASHYSAPTESYEKIELIRGTGALQYGAQFGGMINFVTKKPDTLRPFSFESVNTVGSFGLVSSYNAIGGTIKKLSYYAYYYRRHSTGYRDNSESDADAQFVQLQYRFSENITVRIELGRSKYLYQIPGPLNDSMFHASPQMSTRSRNYFSPDIYVPSVSLDWKIRPKTSFSLTSSGVFGDRNSVQFDAFANVPDVIDPATNSYKNRQVDIDQFHSRTLEARILHQYHIGKIQAKLATGAAYLNNDLHRRQLGKGTVASDYDLSVTAPGFTRDMHFRSENIALYAENIFSISKSWSISPGIRWENGSSSMNGLINYYAEDSLPTSVSHRFALLGISTQLMLGNENTLYGGISQAYRPVLFKDIIPASAYESIDKNLKDARGYNLEAGIRGRVFTGFQYDISLFSLLYNNRMGSVVLQDNNGNSIVYRTNTGNNRTNGVEAFLQYKFALSNRLYAGIFTSTSYMHSRYISGEISNGTRNQSIVGNKVESVPEWISRNGIDFLFRGFSATILSSYTAASYSDALNTKSATANGAKGIVPAYNIWDVNASLKLNQMFSVRAGINNIFDKQYFTKRPTMYPGPGIWPSDGRNGYVTVAIRL